MVWLVGEALAELLNHPTRSRILGDVVGPLIPPPRAHQLRYHGVLATGASLRDRIVPGQSPRLVGGEATMRLVAAIEDPDVARRILECSTPPVRAPPLGEGTGRPGEPSWLEEDSRFDPSTDCDEP